jgi:hypothetical protein
MCPRASSRVRRPVPVVPRQEPEPRVPGPLTIQFSPAAILLRERNAWEPPKVINREQELVRGLVVNAQWGVDARGRVFFEKFLVLRRSP